MPRKYTKAYIVTANGKPSREGYATLEQAQEFIRERTNRGAALVKEADYVWRAYDHTNGITYEIHDINIWEA